MPSKRHEEKARALVEARFGPVILPPKKHGVVSQADLLAVDIATALASAEAELVKRMMEPTSEMLRAGDLSDDAMAELVWKDMLTAFCKSEGLSLPETEVVE